MVPVSKALPHRESFGGRGGSACGGRRAEWWGGPAYLESPRLEGSAVRRFDEERLEVLFPSEQRVLREGGLARDDRAHGGHLLQRVVALEQRRRRLLKVG